MGRSAALGARRRKASEKLAIAALGYAALGWPVCQGASQIRTPAAGRACSCDRVGCPAPGAHPLSPAWQLEASADPGVVAQWWSAAPRSSILLVSGRIFDVLDVPASAGRTALARLGQAEVRPGPVAASTAAAGAGDRTLFFVASRAAAAEEDEWWSCHLDCEPETVPAIAGLRWHCRNSYVLAPPSTPGGSAARWLVRPDAAPLPDALRLLEYLADACEEIGR
ncbi:MAG TPA: bifunctional DNA primase/polymerase [Streptosporangiaceae bacterium]|nr:bifunctional DNA primase/polymerase [Streptosporangiaceae bacterium]